MSPITRILPAGERALLLEYQNLDAVLAHYAALTAARLDAVRELVPAATTILVRFDPRLTQARDLAATLRGVPAAEHVVSELPPVTIPVVYRGEDIEEIAGLLNVSVAEVVRRHTEATWQGAFAGFAPGFVYCVGNDPLFDLPRRPSPRTRIPAGAVALAGGFSAVYPRESPGGWQLLGRTPQRMWDLDREAPALIQPGQEVRYAAVREEIDLSQAAVPTSALPEVAPGAAAIEVVRPGMQLLLQDYGRPGFADIGIDESGAADRGALRAANLRVGNEPDTVALEFAGGAAELLSHTDGVIAWVGASGRRSLISSEGLEYPLAADAPTAIAAGDRIKIAGFQRGQRGYLAIRGGFVSPVVLGSGSTDTLSGLGAPMLKAGDVLAVGDAALAGPVEPGGIASSEPAAAEECVTLNVVLGPRTDWFTPEGVETLTSQDWLVTPQSDRVGARLAADEPLQRATVSELPSEGAVAGAIQVPTDGQPVLFLRDHPTTGGYPVIGVVVDADLDRAGQLAPGMRVRFRIARPFSDF
ncbi:5-oxoprolinase subunit B/C family protein [Gulosibacter chungangensis]|uniref:5-oxoprolinase/urea amidolyase family protein n=1 Tax=Gulosibacter chungangensis TaxID=979746 RepID=A0A7J5BEM3_9MICO|nr:urea amidolyase family protein [Gulosibacter chungangensis]KAB1644717.1 5-oxoprolinase/urea amidolyase family protein [Gulosibacter chungangensis]